MYCRRGKRGGRQAGPPVGWTRIRVLPAQQASRLIRTVCAIRLGVLPARYVLRQADLHGTCDQVRCLDIAASVIETLVRPLVGPG